MMNELLLSDNELDLIWCLPYITQRERLKAIAKAQLDKILESRLLINDTESEPEGFHYSSGCRSPLFHQVMVE